jgi:phenylacetate-CoA ligase
LQKEGAPLIRYRTHDLTREITEPCSCGSSYPQIEAIIGRSDDMVKVKGAIIYPSKVDEYLAGVNDASSEYQIMIDHMNGRDQMTLFFETNVKAGAERQALEKEVEQGFKKSIGILAKIRAVNIGELPRSEKKTTRIFDNRY